MKNNIDDILKELYLIDSSLQQRENELKLILLKIIETKPNIIINKDFKEKLEQELNSKITQIKVNNYSNNKKLSFFQTFSYFFWALWLACFCFIIWEINFKNPISHAPLIIPKEIIKSINTQDSKEIALNRVWEKATGKSISTAKDGAIKEDFLPSESATLSALPELSKSLNISNSIQDTPNPMMTEYIQENYHFTFRWSLDINLDMYFPTFKKDIQKSSYFLEELLELETNKDNILKVAWKWWKDGFLTPIESRNKKDIYLELQNPKIWYMNIYHFMNGKNQEYFIPCVIFGVIKNQDANNYYQNEVIIPLVKEIYIYDEKWSIIWVKN